MCAGSSPPQSNRNSSDLRNGNQHGGDGGSSGSGSNNSSGGSGDGSNGISSGGSFSGSLSRRLRWGGLFSGSNLRGTEGGRSGSGGGSGIRGSGEEEEERWAWPAHVDPKEVVRVRHAAIAAAAEKLLVQMCRLKAPRGGDGSSSFSGEMQRLGMFTKGVVPPF